MSVEVGLVGLPNSGKTTLFNALTGAGAEITAYETVSEKPNVGVAPIADDRLEPVARVLGSAKATPAALRVVDIPGHGAALFGALRRVDALLAVLNGFAPGAQPDADLETIALELLLADREHVARRLERVARQAKSGDPKLKEEVAALERLAAHLESGATLAGYPEELPPELEPLTTKPLISVVNGPAELDAKLEAELAELDEADAAAFREGSPSALQDIVRRLFEALDLVTFLTGNDKETRGWTLRRGQTALDAAAAVHTDMARGFIRCEVVGWEALVDAGSRAEAASRGVQRLEGKTYVVSDGDVLNIRFNV